MEMAFITLLFWRNEMPSIEERVAKLEQEVRDLRATPIDSERSAKKPNWISKISGSFKDDPEFDEILRLGREERHADILNNE